jgi:UDP-N-acetyl-D-mannosaminuronic acid dehydrogenase
MKDNPPVRVAVIGLGYVGLTLGVALARRGVKIVGVERRPEVVESTNRGVPHFSEVGLADALSTVIRSGLFEATESLDGFEPCEYYIITVGTPLSSESGEPRLDMIETAAGQVAGHFPNGATVILRSTVVIGTTRDVVKPVLDRSGKLYHLSMCPERTLEGDALRELANLPQIVGGIDELSGDRAASLFSRLTQTIVRVDNPETAEMIKLIDNTYRDVSFAFGNEVARACVAIGVNAHDVIKFGKLGYPRTNVARPGLVGGPCLEKDPHILRYSLRPYDLDLEITRAARLINERQPVETVSTMLRLAEQHGLGNRPLTAAVLGIAFKGVPETDDLRGSMALKVIDALHDSGRFAEIRLYDPVIDPESLRAALPDAIACPTLSNAIAGADIAIITNNHAAFTRTAIDEYASGLGPSGFVYDYWNNLDSEPREKKAGFYYTVGNLEHGQ